MNRAISYIITAVVALGLIFGAMYGYAHFRLWSVEYSGRALEIEKEYKGKAILAEAINARKARVEAAKAEEEAAVMTANAIAIVGGAAQKYPEYRQQEFYLALGESLKEGKIEQIIYLPTEAGMPITEAERLAK